jgi:hypothetical protein
MYINSDILSFYVMNMAQKCLFVMFFVSPFLPERSDMLLKPALSVLWCAVLYHSSCRPEEKVFASKLISVG